MPRLIGLWLAVLTAAACADKLDEARDQIRAGHVDAAIELLQKQVAQDPGAVDVGILLGQTLLAQERFDEADAAVARALAKNGSDARLHCLLGDLRYREGRIFDADKEYKAAVSLDPKNARAVYGISRVFRASSLRKKAAEMLQVAHALDSHDPEIASAFFGADRRSPAAVARMKEELGKDDSPRNRRLQLRIAEAEALERKPECDASATDQPHHIPLTALMDGRRITGMSLPIKIGGARGDLRFDTGATGLLLSNRFAVHAGIRRLGDSEITGVGNGPEVQGWIGYAPEVQIGEVEFHNCLVTVSEKGSADDSGGLIGSDIFRRFLVKINFVGRGVDLAPLPGPAWDGETRVNRYEGPELAGFTQMLISGHYLLIPAQISHSKKTQQTSGLLLLDTGAGMNMISTNLAPAVGKVHNSETQVRGISGKVKNVYEADQIVLQFANFRQTNLDLTSFDLTNFSRSAGMEISGIMGLPLIGMFEAVTLDYRDGRVKFDYKR